MIYFGENDPAHFYFLSFLDACTGWAAAPQLQGATTDGEATWNTLALSKDRKDLAAIANSTVTEGILLNNAGTLFVTTNAGRTWKRESVATTYNDATLYLTHDGLTLTAIDGWSDWMVLR